MFDPRPRCPVTHAVCLIADCATGHCLVARPDGDPRPRAMPVPPAQQWHQQIRGLNGRLLGRRAT